ncbi:unnamed protein product [Caenorhabditis auriculariae]|uniref:MADF domain-containing protein n=1 Tax=Caenorhabditis auriculariae TaxID=2777116 RepID=A0A8S1GQD6_9PELO|nr:unnamed protein product [Caenorhabditis auriculariae]
MERWDNRASVMESKPLSPSFSTHMITDEVRFSLIDAVCLKPGIWDSQREKTTGISRRELFADVAEQINQQFQLAMSLDDVERLWKNLKDTYVKTRKRVSYDQEGCVIPPKWKFYQAMMFLDNLGHSPSPQPRSGKRTTENDNGYYLTPPSAKRTREESEDMDEYMGFCKSLYHPLREIGYKDRVQLLKAQKAIRDIIHDAQMEALMSQIN